MTKREPMKPAPPVTRSVRSAVTTPAPRRTARMRAPRARCDSRCRRRAASRDTIRTAPRRRSGRRGARGGGAPPRRRARSRRCSLSSRCPSGACASQSAPHIVTVPSCRIMSDEKSHAQGGREPATRARLDVDRAAEGRRVDRHHEVARAEVRVARRPPARASCASTSGVRMNWIDVTGASRPRSRLRAQECLHVADDALEVIAAAHRAIAVAVVRVHRALEPVEAAREQLVRKRAAQATRRWSRVPRAARPARLA